jgi:3-methyl-2-oxobutanoate hydroxymethyltransferase
MVKLKNQSLLMPKDMLVAIDCYMITGGDNVSERRKVTLPTIRAQKQRGEKITMITCYDYSMGALVEAAGIDLVLVGDSLGMTMLGYKTTLPVTMDDMLRHTAAVTRSCKSPFIIGDMPYMSYQPSVELAVLNAGRFMAEAGADGVKLEGGVHVADRVTAIARAGIPVMGHLGLTPQYYAMLGGFTPQGRDASVAKQIIDDALALEAAGAFAILLEYVPDQVSQIIVERCAIPIISIGSGPSCDGQVLIFHDMFGLYPDFQPKFAKVFADAGALIRQGLQAYVDEVRGGTFPDASRTITISPEQLAQLREMLR